MSEATEADTVAVEVREAIAWVKFNRPEKRNSMSPTLNRQMLRVLDDLEFRDDVGVPAPVRDRKSTRLNSSHTVISYAVFCLKKKIPRRTAPRFDSRPSS